MGKVIAIVWLVICAIGAWSGFLSATQPGASQGDWSVFWFSTALFLVIPAVVIGGLGGGTSSEGLEPRQQAKLVRLKSDLQIARARLNSMSWEEPLPSRQLLERQIQSMEHLEAILENRLPSNGQQSSVPAQAKQTETTLSEGKYDSTDKVTEAGNRIGRKLASTYIQAVKSSGGKLTLDDLLSDLDKDLNDNFIRAELGVSELASLTRLMSFEALYSKLRDSAHDGFFHLVSQWEKGQTQNFGAAHMPSQNSKPVQTRPQPRMHLTPVEFEHYCVEWAVYLGYQDAQVTRAVKDGGVDISSRSMVAQCKYQELPVGVKPIRELYGLAQGHKKRPLFFSLNGYSRDAVREAQMFEMELWVVKPLEGRIERVVSAEGMNSGDYHSGPSGYSPNASYPDSQYGSNFARDAD